MATTSVLPADPLPAQDPALQFPPALLHELRQALRSIRFGSIELVIHDGRVVQLERCEKVRFEPDAGPSRR